MNELAVKLQGQGMSVFSSRPRLTIKWLAPPALPVLPAWSPVAKFGGYAAPLAMSGCACSLF